MKGVISALMILLCSSLRATESPESDLKCHHCHSFEPLLHFLLLYKYLPPLSRVCLCFQASPVRGSLGGEADSLREARPADQGGSGGDD